MNFNKPIKYSEHIKNVMDIGEINRIYLANNINSNRSDLYFDYVTSLCNTIFNTYLGDELYDVDDKINHFDWCWKWNNTFYGDLGYDLKQSESGYMYFLSFFTDIYYFIDNNNIILEGNILMVWEYIFNYDISKPKKDVYNFIDIYKMFENTKWYGNGENDYISE